MTSIGCCESTEPLLSVLESPKSTRFRRPRKVICVLFGFRNKDEKINNLARQNPAKNSLSALLFFGRVDFYPMPMELWM